MENPTPSPSLCVAGCPGHPQASRRDRLALPCPSHGPPLPREAPIQTGPMQTPVSWQRLNH